ncbi:MAG: hypothetical protein LUH58_06075 [Lachnospiraceae bacterium]|nr:hypothetical protein [Lachnospiraceae bacterium]
MSSPKISEQEQLILRNHAKIELERLEKCLADQNTIEMLDAFKNRFNLCETVYKVILSEHQKRKGKQTKGFLKVQMTQVPYALNFAGYKFDKTLLNELFGSSSERGKTVKKLRDEVTHGFNEKAIKEIIQRKDELFGYMDSFLLVIRTFDNAAA